MRGPLRIAFPPMPGDGPTNREERAGRNEALLREVNEQIAQLYETQEGPRDFVQFVCECLLRECHEHISLTLAEYARIRAHPREFVVRPDHVSREVERVVADGGQRYVIVEKFGDAGAVAERG